MQNRRDLAPRSKDALSNESIPKGAARILNAAKVQKEYSERKRKLEDTSEDTGKDSGHGNKRRKQSVGGEGGKGVRANIKIMPGESMAHFSRSVNNILICLIQCLIEASIFVDGWKMQCAVMFLLPCRKGRRWSVKHA